MFRFFVLKHHWCGIFKVFCSIIWHYGFYVLRFLLKIPPPSMLGMSCLRFATMGDATLQDVPFNFQTFYYHWWCYAPKSSWQFSNIMDATFQDLVWNVLKNPTLLVLRFRFSSQFSDIIGASLYTIFFLHLTHHWCYAPTPSLQFSANVYHHHHWWYVPKSCF